MKLLVEKKVYTTYTVNCYALAPFEFINCDINEILTFSSDFLTTFCGTHTPFLLWNPFVLKEILNSTKQSYTHHIEGNHLKHLNSS